MRGALIAIVCAAATGCDEEANAGFMPGPHQTCEEVEGLAPCCEPPDPSEIECPEGTKLYVDGSGNAYSAICRSEPQGPIEGPYVSWTPPLDDAPPRHGYMAWGTTTTRFACSHSGRLAWEQDISSGCYVQCYEPDGRPSVPCWRQPEECKEE